MSDDLASPFDGGITVWSEPTMNLRLMDGVLEQQFLVHAVRGVQRGMTKEWRPVPVESSPPHPERI
jgi:hypothetical protein